MKNPNEKFHVVVIGAGMSGLHAALELKKKGKNVCLLEARDRVGGRSLNHTFKNGDLVDVGGQWVGPGHDRMYDLAKRYNLDTYPLYNRGDNLIRFKKNIKKYTGTIPKINVLHLVQVGWMLWRFDQLAKTIDPESPYKHKHAEKWDGQTVQNWMEKNSFSKAAKKVFAIGIKAIFTVEPKELSMLHALFYAKSGVSMDCLISVDGGAQQDRIHGGTQSICLAMADELSGSLYLDHAVSLIDHSEQGANVKCANGTSFSADKLIIAVPPNQLLRMQFDPLLSSNKDQLWQRMPAGSCIKCVAQYKTPFWRDKGLSGQTVGLDDELLVNVTFDNTEKGKNAGLLMGFIEGDNARYWGQKSDEERKEAVIECFAKYFGDEALTPIDYVDKDWSAEQWTRGCYAANLGLGAWTEFGENLRSPVGVIHFAGTETASQWYGYFEGALQSAERAVKEVLV
mgnify:FL=1